MKALWSALLVLTIFTSSCSTWLQSQDAERSIASEVNAPIKLEQLFTIQSTSETVNGADFTKSMKNILFFNGVQIVFNEDPKMDAGTAYKIIPEIESNAYKIKIFHSMGAKFDKEASEELKFFLIKLALKKFLSPYSLFELYYNAKAGDFLSLQTVAKIRLDTLTDITGHNTLNGLENTLTNENLLKWKNINDQFVREERIYNKQIKNQEELRKAVMDSLDKASDDGQFRNLVAKNDRKGAAALLRKYLPWEHMPPFEKLFWENHLTIMADPLPLENRIILYRGINDDIIQVAQIGEKELTREEATKEQKMFLMSTMMTKNQGTWNRRLRSLTAMYEKYMGTDNSNSSEFTKSTRITNMFVKHSSEPKGSPFLSYTPNFDVAYHFGSQKNTMYFIDPRMIYFNYASHFANEMEFLLPITSFPEDLAAIYDNKIHPDIKYTGMPTFMKNLAIEKLEKELGSGKGTAMFNRIEQNSTKYFKQVIKKVKGGSSSVVTDEKLLAFFKNLVGMPTKKVADVLDEDSDMTCFSLLQMFWK